MPNLCLKCAWKGPRAGCAKCATVNPPPRWVRVQKQLEILAAANEARLNAALERDRQLKDAELEARMADARTARHRRKWLRKIAQRQQESARGA